MRQTAKTLVAVGAALALGTGSAYANEQHGSKTTAQGQAGEKAAGEKAAAPGRAATHEAAAKHISGKVLQATPDKLYLEHMGAVVEFTVAPDAKFSGGNVSSSKDLKEGQEVRASFAIENKTTNVAKQISVMSEGAPAGRPGAAPPSGAPGAPSGPGERGMSTTPQQRGEKTAPAPQR